jgi:glutamate--cysteine ligase
VRGADAGDSRTRVAALTALWTGLLYDAESLEAAWERAGGWTTEERHLLDTEVPRHGFNTPFRGGTVQELCLWALDLARQGLERRNCRNPQGLDESCYLTPLEQTARTGKTFAEQLLQRFETDWGRDIDMAVRSMCQEASS